MSAPTIPRPSHLLPGRPDAVIDLQTDEGAALVAGRWRFAPTRVEEIDFVDVGPDLGPSGPSNRTYDVQPHAEGVDYDDSGWRQLTPAPSTGSHSCKATTRWCCCWAAANTARANVSTSGSWSRLLSGASWRSPSW